ncbi:MAG: carbohydrate ABC transporter permease [Anaerolineae bacterium]|nr:carbohydrate ABC transporter permease [Anaerolineae bacterium]
MKSYRLTQTLQNAAVYLVLTGFAALMLFPFIFMIATSLKEPADTFRYPPRLLPRAPVFVEMAGYEQDLPLYYVTVDGDEEQYALVESGIRVGRYAPADNLAMELVRPLTDVTPTEEMALVNGEEKPLFLVEQDGQLVPMVLVGQTALGRFVNPEDPTQETLANVRLSQPVERLTAHPDNYRRVVELNNMGRALTNTALVTILVVIGQITTSVVGGYAFARLKFPGRDSIFLFYLGTIMIPFVMLIIPLYQIMVLVGWVDRLASLIIPWIFTAYGTFLMRQFFITVPKEVEEAALIDGASRWQILLRIFIPASVPALATQATFTFLYAWNSFFWPLVIINTGNERNHVLTLALNVLRGRASDAPNLILAGAAISIIPPLIVFILGQRFFVESATSSAVKG